MAKVIIINGSGGAGKDTFVGFCNKYANVMQHSSIDTVKAAARVLGWTGGKRPGDRKFLSELKALTVWYNDLPFKEMVEVNTEAQKRTDLDAIFFHVREADEIERCKQEFGALTLLIRKRGLFLLGKSVFGNPSDDNVEKYEYDVIVDNDSDLELLEFRAKKFTYKYILEQSMVLPNEE